jgi:excisionase family DNA binding protein
MPRKRIMPGLDDLDRTPDAVERSGLSKRTLYRLAAEGSINVYKVGAVTYWSRAELDALVTRRRVVA